MCSSTALTGSPSHRCTCRRSNCAVTAGVLQTTTARSQHGLLSSLLYPQAALPCIVHAGLDMRHHTKMALTGASSNLRDCGPIKMWCSHTLCRCTRITSPHAIHTCRPAMHQHQSAISWPVGDVKQSQGVCECVLRPGPNPMSSCAFACAHQHYSPPAFAG